MNNGIYYDTRTDMEWCDYVTLNNNMVHVLT